MCEFCTKHGEGKKWYLNAENYSLDLLSDLKRRKFIQGFFPSTMPQGQKQISRMEEKSAKGKRMPALIKKLVVRQMKRVHYGQVLPIEDVERIFEMANSIARVPCGCRWEAKHKEGRYCFGVSVGPPHWFDDMDMSSFGTPELSQLETLTRDQAVKYIHDFDSKGLVHSVWTFRTPFIGGVCNCDRVECLAMRATVGLDLPVMFRAEYVAEIDIDLCSGCRECARLCQFGAIKFSLMEGKCFIDERRCFGCGVCRTACEYEAIHLSPRTAGDRAAG